MAFAAGFVLAVTAMVSTELVVWANRERARALRAEEPEHLAVCFSTNGDYNGRVRISIDQMNLLATVEARGTQKIPIKGIPPGEHHVFFKADGLAGQWSIIDVEKPGMDPPPPLNVSLFAKRYVVMRYTVNTAGGRTLPATAKDSVTGTGAFCHWSAPPYCGVDWQIWQRGEPGFWGTVPHLQFHRMGGHYGLVRVNVPYDELTEAPEVGYQNNGFHPIARKGEVWACKTSTGFYGKLVVEDVTEMPPPGVKVVTQRMEME